MELNRAKLAIGCSAARPTRHSGPPGRCGQPCEAVLKAGAGARNTATASFFSSQLSCATRPSWWGGRTAAASTLGAPQSGGMKVLLATWRVAPTAAMRRSAWRLPRSSSLRRLPTHLPRRHAGGQRQPERAEAPRSAAMQATISRRGRLPAAWRCGDRRGQTSREERGRERERGSDLFRTRAVPAAKKASDTTHISGICTATWRLYPLPYLNSGGNCPPQGGSE